MEVTLKLLESLEQSLNLEEGTVVNSVIDVKLQLWGAAVPMNTWSSHNISKDSVDGFVYDAKGGVGACGDWILDPSVAGAWESGRRLANWILSARYEESSSEESSNKMSVGLPNRSSSNEEDSGGVGGGKFVPSRNALGSGIGSVPTSPGSAEYGFPPQSNDTQSNRSTTGRCGRGGRGNNNSTHPTDKLVFSCVS